MDPWVSFRDLSSSDTSNNISFWSKAHQILYALQKSWIPLQQSHFGEQLITSGLVLAALSPQVFLLPHWVSPSHFVPRLWQEKGASLTMNVHNFPAIYYVADQIDNFLYDILAWESQKRLLWHHETLRWIQMHIPEYESFNLETPSQGTPNA